MPTCLLPVQQVQPISKKSEECRDNENLDSKNKQICFHRGWITMAMILYLILATEIYGQRQE